MANRQRFRLGEKYGQGPAYYHATFHHLTHKVNQQHKKVPMILLKDIYLVDRNDKKIRLSNKNDFVDKTGRHIVADHCWVKLTKPWFDLKQELLFGDQIYFEAEVEKYKITRDDVLEKREQIWKAAKAENQRIYQRWAKYTDTHHRKNFDLSLKKMKQKQAQNIKKAKVDQQKLELVDYSLNRIKKIKISKIVSNLTYCDKEIPNYEQYKKWGYRYSSWLAARSIDYVQHAQKK